RAREVGDRHILARVLLALAEAMQAGGDSSQASALLHESLELFQALQREDGLASCLWQFARLAMDQAQAERAAKLLGAAARLVADSPLFTPAENAALERDIPSLRGQLSDERFNAAFAAGQALSFQQAARLPEEFSEMADA